MKNFYPAIILENGEIIHNSFASSHNDLLDLGNRNYNNPLLVTYRPIDMEKYRLDDLDNYTLIINQNNIPEWFDDIAKKQAIEKLHHIIENMIITKRRKLALNEGIILNNTANVVQAKNAKIFALNLKSRLH